MAEARARVTEREAENRAAFSATRVFLRDGNSWATLRDETRRAVFCAMPRPQSTRCDVTPATKIGAVSYLRARQIHEKDILWSK